jgi:ABC-type Na+ efflux pump permease subunit
VQPGAAQRDCLGQVADGHHVQRGDGAVESVQPDVDRHPVVRPPGRDGSGARVGAPPLVSVLWLLLAVLPIAALFSALALAVAAFARSSKEGQYYLMPLLLITLPLMMLSLLPAAEWNWGPV